MPILVSSTPDPPRRHSRGGRSLRVNPAARDGRSKAGLLSFRAVRSTSRAALRCPRPPAETARRVLTGQWGSVRLRPRLGRLWLHGLPGLCAPTQLFHAIHPLDCRVEREVYLLNLDGWGSVRNPAERHFVLAGVAVFERQIYHLLNDADRFVETLGLRPKMSNCMPVSWPPADEACGGAW